MFTRSLLLTSSALLLAGSAQAQGRYFFSVNWHGPTVGAIDPGGTAITEGDILRPFNGTSLPAIGAQPTPQISFNHVTGLGLPPVCVGHPGGTPCIVEVDAFSRGGDRPFSPSMEIMGGDIMFSVDEFARGNGSGPAPNVSSEALAREAAPDGFTTLQPMAPGPIAPIGNRNIGVIDGDGLPSASGYAYPGCGMIEPNTPFGGLPDSGDNKDAMDLVEPVVAITGAYYFSLDSGFFDPFEGVPNSGSAAANGFVGGDILVSGVGAAAPLLWAPSFLLGLDLVGGPDSDDLDALILWDNGNGVFDLPTAPYSWMGGSDMVVFSVRRGSALIGMPDSIFGLPIEEGDLLIPPVLGGASPLPGIFVAAEALGLLTRRSGTANIGDDVTAADSIFQNFYDCDGDGIEDAVAIGTGLVLDLNLNGIPDTCESGVVGTPFCFCPSISAPCGNASPTTGCINAVGTGALLSGFGSTSVTADDLVLTTSGMVPATFALTFMGTATTPPGILANGLRCVGGTLYRFAPYSTGLGTASIGLGAPNITGGLVNYTQLNNPLPGQIMVGSTWHFQTFYRDVGGPCGGFFNLSSALSVGFTL